MLVRRRVGSGCQRVFNVPMKYIDLIFFCSKKKSLINLYWIVIFSNLGLLRSYQLVLGYFFYHATFERCQVWIYAKTKSDRLFLASKQPFGFGALLGFRQFIASNNFSKTWNCIRSVGGIIQHLHSAFDCTNVQVLKYLSFREPAFFEVLSSISMIDIVITIPLRLIDQPI